MIALADGGLRRERKSEQCTAGEDCDSRGNALQ
jgi:hypothetical protein